MNTAPPRAWPDAAVALAQKVERRARLGALCLALGTGLAAGAVLALAVRVAGHAAFAMPLLLAGALAGLLVGLRRQRRVPRVAAGDAAWALDRLVGAHEQGLTAALLGVERAGAADRPPPAPPRVRLRPPQGLSVLAGGGVLAALVLVVGRSATESAGATDDDGGVRVVGHATGPVDGPVAGPDAGSPASRQAEQRALEAERVRRALGLTAAEGEDPAAVAERLTDPEARAAARAAAAPDGALAQALDGERPSGDAVAGGLRSGARAADALEEQRRADLARANRSAAPRIPAARRALVERYFVLRTQGAR